MKQTHNFTANGQVAFDRLVDKVAGYSVVVYDGDLGGGTLRLYTDLYGVVTPVPDSKLDASTVDENGDAVQQIVFVSSGALIIELTGATSPNFTVAFQ